MPDRDTVSTPYNFKRFDEIPIGTKVKVDFGTPKATPTPSVQDTLSERGKTHGNFAVQGATAQILKGNMRATNGWSEITLAQREALESIAMKISRILNGNPKEPDHWKDIAGYATLIENILVHGKSHLE